MKTLSKRLGALILVLIIGVATATPAHAAVLPGNQYPLYFFTVRQEVNSVTGIPEVYVSIRAFDGYLDRGDNPPVSIALYSNYKVAGPEYDRLTTCFANLTCARSVDLGQGPALYYWGPGVIGQITYNWRHPSHPRKVWTVLNIGSSIEAYNSRLNSSEGDQFQTTPQSKLFAVFEVPQCVRQAGVMVVQDNGAVTNWTEAPEIIYHYFGDINC